MLGEMHFCRLHIAEGGRRGEERGRRDGGRREGGGRESQGFRHHKDFFFFANEIKTIKNTQRALVGKLSKNCISPVVPSLKKSHWLFLAQSTFLEYIIK